MARLTTHFPIAKTLIAASIALTACADRNEPTSPFGGPPPDVHPAIAVEPGECTAQGWR
ncbi:MAG: hypothetical protein GWN99_16070 [Gemmatimonadetes bacterium]|uniref:Lipoprotein n=1 Tax=Candidatus Kutchimonas denitrificans TaxID=3056748 RepID=A0AAE4Z8U7_9BACT|nr:hypothetical protein [Gemmatimonadota bacterium]NIR74301.1 hypothetical protein [Candidatus Kutchimonas denitrificans]NIS02556.1 hypothetical protein [Gemmatimonadota bacterium]NIT68432.1 hypothetical protein [Gemmatimonadota bacterium]NIU51884.1 hypothetical protein [Gemmatimonadota bacterium]